MELKFFWLNSKILKYNFSRSWANLIANAVIHLLKDDIQEGDLNRPEITKKLMATSDTAISTSETAIYIAMKRRNMLLLEEMPRY